MSSTQTTQATQTKYRAFMHPLGDDTLRTHVSVASLTEASNGGWAAEVIVLPPPELTASVADAFGGAIIMGIMPGTGVQLHLQRATRRSGGGGSDDDTVQLTTLRFWPGVVMSMQTIRGTLEYTPSYRAQLADPITLLAPNPIWGVYVNESIGNVIGGAISLAAGGDGAATLTPVLGTRMPSIEIRQSVRSELQSLPLAIAAGAAFGDWLQDLLALLGARIELSVDIAEYNTVIVEITDAVPDGEVRSMTLSDAHLIDETHATLAAMGVQTRGASRAAVLDNRAVGDAERSDEYGSVGQVIEEMRVEADEAWVRAGFAQDMDYLRASTVTIASLQAGLVPSERIELDSSVFGTREWQVAVSLHKFTNGIYRNVAKLQRGDVAWRAQGGRLEPGVTVTGIVDDGASANGAPVARDRLGRIPVRLSFLKGGEGSHLVTVDDGDDANDSTTPAEWTGEPVPLPVLELIGSGGAHGFVSAHRQGDPCRVVVHSPLNAEIAGFGYREDRRVGADLADSTAGLVVRHSHADDGFTGLVFRPDEDLDEDLQGSGSSSGSGSDGGGS